MIEAECLHSTRSGATYRLGRSFRIGGSMAHEASDADGRRVWIKSVLSGDEVAIARLRYEAVTLGKLNHPGVIRMLDRGRSTTAFFLVLEPPAGHALTHVIENERPALHIVLRIVTQLAEQLVYLHQQGIVCRTLPPRHMYVDSLGRLVQVDFSAAWDEISPRRSNASILDARYFSPEDAGGAAVERRSDIYVFGVLLWELLTGQPLFGGSNRGKLALAHLLTPLPSLALSRPDLPPHMVDLLHCCLEKTPAQRFRDAPMLLAAVRAADQNRAQPAAEPAGLRRAVGARATGNGHIRMLEEGK